MIKIVFWDLDDTLILNGHHYFIPQLDCAKIIVSELNELSPDPATMIIEANKIRVKLMESGKPVPQHVFGQSWIQYYTEICGVLNIEPRMPIISALGVTAALWFRENYELRHGIKEMLEGIDIKQVVVTVGTPDIQMYKIENTNLHTLVDAIEVVSVKNEETYRNLLEKYNVKAEEAIMIGDNENWDIIPALGLGMKTYHVVHPFRANKMDGHPLYSGSELYTPITSALEMSKHLCPKVSI